MKIWWNVTCLWFGIVYCGPFFEWFETREFATDSFALSVPLLQPFFPSGFPFSLKASPVDTLEEIFFLGFGLSKFVEKYRGQKLIQIMNYHLTI